MYQTMDMYSNVKGRDKSDLPFVVCIEKSSTSLFNYHTYLILVMTALCHLDHSKLYNPGPTLCNDIVYKKPK